MPFEEIHARRSIKIVFAKSKILLVMVNSFFVCYVYNIIQNSDLSIVFVLFVLCETFLFGVFFCIAINI